MKVFFKVLTLGLIAFGILLCVAIIKSDNLDVEEDRLANLRGIAQWVFLISGGWCMAGAALRALWDKPIKAPFLVGAGCVLATVALSSPGWDTGLALALTAVSVAAFAGRESAKSG